MSNRLLTVIPFKPEHLHAIKPKAIHNGEIPRTIQTEAVTVMDGPTPMAIFGMFVFVPGVLHIWALVSDDVYRKPIAFFKVVRNLLDFYEDRTKPRRVQMDVKAGHPELQKFAEALGFEHEGTMKRYGANGEDFHLYGRTR